MSEVNDTDNEADVATAAAPRRQRSGQERRKVTRCLVEASVVLTNGVGQSFGPGQIIDLNDPLVRELHPSWYETIEEK